MWAVLGADQDEKWPKPEQEGDLSRDLDRKVALARAIRAKSGPNPSGNGIRKGSGPSRPAEAPRSLPRRVTDFVYEYTDFL